MIIILISRNNYNKIVEEKIIFYAFSHITYNLIIVTLQQKKYIEIPLYYYLHKYFLYFFLSYYF